MKSIKGNSICVLLLFIVLACSNKKNVSPEELVNWVEDEKNGLVKTKEINGTTYQLCYKPIEYIAVKELLIDKAEINEEMLAKKIKELDGLHYLDLKIKTKDKTSYENYIVNSIQLSQKDSSLTCRIMHEEHVPLSNSSNYITAFDKAKTVNDILYTVYDETGNVGRINFIFSIKELQNIPQLKIN